MKLPGPFSLKWFMISCVLVSPFYLMIYSCSKNKPVEAKQQLENIKQDDSINWGDDDSNITSSNSFDDALPTSKNTGTKSPEKIESYESIGKLKSYEMFKEKDYEATKLEFTTGHVFYVYGMHRLGFWEYDLVYTTNSNFICRSGTKNYDGFIHWDSDGNNMLTVCYEVKTD